MTNCESCNNIKTENIKDLKEDTVLESLRTSYRKKSGENL